MRTTNANPFAILVLWLGASATGLTVVGQDPFDQAGAGDPFGAASPFGGAVNPAGNGPATGAPNQYEQADPLIEELRRYSGGNLTRLAIAIRSAIQIADWEEARAYLKVLGGKALTDAQYASIATIVKPHYLLRLLQHPTLSATEQAGVQKIFRGAQTHAEDRTRIAAAIAQLDSPNQATALAAIRTIRNGGRVAIAELTSAYVGTKPSASRTALLSMLRRFEQEAFVAIQQFALHGQPSAREHAIECLAALNAAAAVPDLVSAYRATDATKLERQNAGVGLGQVLRGMPSTDETQQYLARAVTQAVAFAASVSHSDTPETVWQLSEDKQTLDAISVPEKVAAMRRAANASYRYLRTDSATPDFSIEATTASLGYRMISDPLFSGGEKRIDDTRLLEHVLQHALKDRNEYAAIAALRMLGASTEQELVASAGATRRLLVQTSSHASPRVRYEAAMAIAKVDKTSGYSGSSDSLHRWIEMSSLRRRPTALLLESRRHRTSRLVGWLESLGYQVEIMPRVRDLLNRLEKGGDFQLLLAGSQPADRHIIETVDLVRRNRLGGAIPMIIYCQPMVRLMDEDFREPVLNSAGFVIGDVVDINAPVEEEGSIDADPFGFDAQPVQEIPIDNAVNKRMELIKRHHAISKERIEILAALRERWDAPQTVVEEIASPLELSLLISDLQQKLPMPELASVERLSYARHGISILENIVKSKNGQILYDLLSHEAELARAVQQGGFSESGLTLLSGLGSQQSQRLLADLAATSTLPQTTRQRAATALANSIQRFGTRLDRADVVLQYERFNTASQQADQAVLGIILDAMEQRVNVTSR